ncbi:MAG: glycosyltransferase [Rhodopseudomonas sp.]|nr:glycosyltransferase [Rhodopseudomonas sp.]
MNPKLLVVAAGYPTETSFAGAFHRDQFRLVAESGFDVTVVVPTPWVPPVLGRLRRSAGAYAAAPMRQVDGAVTILRPRYVTVPRETRWFFPDLTQYLSVRALGLPRPDIIQGFYGYPPGAVARRLALAWRVPYFVGLLGDDVNLYPAQRARTRRVLTAVARDAAFAFANGPTLAATATQVTQVPVHNLPIGVAAERFSNLPARREARAALGLPDDKVLALYVGSLLPAKGTAELADALGRLAETNIVGVAVGDGPLRDRFCQEKNALWLGSRPANEVALAMAAADFLVHPSHSEGLPIAVLEAAFARLPIIITDARGCIDLGRDGRAVLVPVNDPAALASAMRQAADDPAAMTSRAQTMFDHVQEHYSLKTNTQRLISLYREQLAGRGQR